MEMMLFGEMSWHHRLWLLLVIGFGWIAVGTCADSSDFSVNSQFPRLFEYDEFEICRSKYREQYVYCIVRARIVPDDGSPLWKNISVYSEDSRHYDHRVLERGMCVQNYESSLQRDVFEGHTYSDLFRAVINQRLKMNFGLQVEPDVQIYHCYSKDNEIPPYDSLEILFMIIIVILAALVCYSTGFDLSIQSSQRFPENYFTKQHKTSRERLFTSFSIPRNIRRLKDPVTSGIRQELTFLESFRFIQMHRVVTLHIVLALVKAPKDNPEHLEHLLHQPLIIHYIAEFQNYVQTFFSISGMLLTINFLEHIRKNPQFNPRYFWERIRARLYRIIPAYLFILLLETSINRRFMNGPLAHHMIGHARERCRQRWWNNLLFLNNYIGTDQPCLIQTWYLAADMQLFILALGCLMVIWRWPFLKKYILSAGFAWGILTTILVAYARNLPPVMTEDLKLYEEYNFGHQYFQLYEPFHMNITIYFAGMIAGFVYHRFRESRKEFHTSSLQFCLLLLTVFLYFFTTFTDSWVVRNQSMIAPILLAIYNSCFKHAWGLLCTMIQLRTALAASWSRFRSFFSHPIFVVLGKLCYSFYLIHLTVIVQVVGSVKQPIHFSVRGVFEFMMPTFMWMLLYGTLLCILIELPSNFALREFFESKPDEKPATIDRKNSRSSEAEMNGNTQLKTLSNSN
ncbi:nose resistant to fluoxetine protein 6-like [Ochlerotatus camptorhynchus]|uniref:nose resistant to fluoxetine protein 6-like n=1 Tax=Ochlerotatus camptorhynchus TaxID=644619 RepID=UPI0031DA8F66